MIKSIVAPLIFGTLVMGIAGHGDDLKRIGRLAIKSMGYFWVMTTIALAIGLTGGQPGPAGRGREPAAARSQRAAPPAAQMTFGSFLEHVVPQSFFEAAARNEVLQVVFWSVLFAIALTQVTGRPKEAILAFAEGVAEVMFKFVAIIMRYAPIGIGAAMAVTVGHSGIDVIVNLGKLVLTLYGALIVFVLVALIPAALLARIPHPGLRAAGEGPGGHRVHHDQLRRGAADRDAADDRVRGPPAASSPSSCRPATRSTSTARRCISASPRSSWRRPRGSR